MRECLLLVSLLMPADRVSAFMAYWLRLTGAGLLLEP